MAGPKVTYERRRLDAASYDPQFESTVYDAAYYEHYRDLLKAGVPFIRRFFLTALPPFQSIVDIGCGTGDFIRPMIDDGKDAWGIDFSVGSQETSVLGDRLIIKDLTKPLELGRHFDVVTCFEVYEHIPAGEHERAFLENIKSLAPAWIIMSCAGVKTPGKDVGELKPETVSQRGRRHYNCLRLSDFVSRVASIDFVPDGLRTIQWSRTPAIPSYLRHNTVVFRHRDLPETFESDFPF